jgi:hypothetical protein
MEDSSKTIAGPHVDECFLTVQHQGEAKGTFASFAKVETYVATPGDGRKAKGVVLFYSDVFGELDSWRCFVREEAHA